MRRLGEDPAPERARAPHEANRDTLMETLASSAAPRTPWRILRVQIGDPSFPTTITGPARLVALYQWRQGKAAPGVWVIENSPTHASPRPEDIDWATFPTADAQREMMDRAFRCARYLLGRSSPGAPE